MYSPVCQCLGHESEHGPATERVTVTTTGPAESLAAISGLHLASSSLTLDVCSACKARILAADERRQISRSAAIW